jgi:hypothetical protein
LPTGKHLQSIHVDIAEFEHDGTIVKTCVIRNTNFIVVITSNFENESTMNIYDLEAMRNQQSTPQEILCASVTVGHII